MSSLDQNDLLPALFLVNIPAVIAAVSHLLFRGDVSSSGHDRPMEEYRRDKKRIFVVTSVDEWEAYWCQIEEEVDRTKVIGFDCEWVTENFSHYKYRRNYGAREEEDEDEDDNDDDGDVCESDETDDCNRTVDGRVSLIQIATVSGLVALVRILRIETVPGLSHKL